MAAVPATNLFKSLHLRRTVLFAFVSFWVGNSVFGLEKTIPESTAEDEFADFDSTPSKPAKVKVETVAPEKRIENLEPQVKKNPKDAKASIELAHAYYDKKEFAKATPLLWKFVDQLQRSDFYILVRSLNQISQADELLKVCNLLISRSDKDFEAFHYQGKAYLMKKKEKEALESFRKALQANTKYFPSYLNIAEIYEKRKNLYELRALYQDMLQAFGPLSEILTRLCSVNTKDGFTDQGEKYCRQAIQKDPSVPENHVNLGLVILQLGDRPKAKEAFKVAATKFPKSEMAVYQYASFLEEDKNFIDSYKTYKGCVEYNPNSEKCMVGFANSAFQIQKLEEAHDTYKKLCKISRAHGVHVRRGLASLRTSGPQEWAKKYQDLSEFCSL